MKIRTITEEIMQQYWACNYDECLNKIFNKCECEIQNIAEILYLESDNQEEILLEIFDNKLIKMSQCFLNNWLKGDILEASTDLDSIKNYFMGFSDELVRYFEQKIEFIIEDAYNTHALENGFDTDIDEMIKFEYEYRLQEAV